MGGLECQIRSMPIFEAPMGTATGFCMDSQLPEFEKGYHLPCLKHGCRPQHTRDPSYDSHMLLNRFALVGLYVDSL